MSSGRICCGARTGWRKTGEVGPEEQESTELSTRGGSGSASGDKADCKTCVRVLTDFASDGVLALAEGVLPPSTPVFDGNSKFRSLGAATPRTPTELDRRNLGPLSNVRTFPGKNCSEIARFGIGDSGCILERPSILPAPAVESDTRAWPPPWMASLTHCSRRPARRMSLGRCVRRHLCVPFNRGWPWADVCALNVGGRVFTVKRETLRVCPNSFLADLFSGRWEGQLQRDGQGNLFLDFDPVIFESLLGWLRDKRIETPERPAALPIVHREDLKHFQAVVDYLGLQPYLSDLPGLCPAGWPPGGGGEPEACGRPPAADRRPAGAATGAGGGGGGGSGDSDGERLERPSLMDAAGSLLASLYGAAAGAVGEAVAHLEDEDEDDAFGDGPPAGVPGAAAGRRAQEVHVPVGGLPVTMPSASSSWPNPGVVATSAAVVPPVQEPRRMVGWSQRVAHPAVQHGRAGDDPSVVSIGDTRSQATAAAVRSTRGYQSSIHYWEIKVLIVSDWSYVGFVSADWDAVRTPIGRAQHSWGVASNGAAFACGGSEIAKLSAGYSEGDSIGFLLQLAGPGRRTASIYMNGEWNDDLFTGLPETLYPAVSNMRSPAKYRLACDARAPSSLGAGLHESQDHGGRSPVW